MHLTKFNKILPSFSIKFRFFSTNVNEEYTETPQYPPIIKLDRKSKKERQVEEWSQQIQAVKTVEEKQMKLNMPRYYGFKTIMLNDLNVPYNSMSFIQHCTRTHFKKQTELNDFYNNINVDASTVEIKGLIEEALLLEYEGYKRDDQSSDKSTAQNKLSSLIVQQINRIILNNLSTKKPHLLDLQIDVNPRHEAFWFVGGIEPPEATKKSRNGREWTKEIANESINRAVQYLGTPSLALRSEQPLEPIIPYSEANDSSLDVPFFNYDPRVLGFNNSHRHGTNIPGFWPGDPYEFGLIAFQNRGHLVNRLTSYGETDNLEALHCQGMMSSFAWLLSQANYQGFTTYNDINYPLVAQIVITNGQEWSFYTYQLNTILMHSDFIHTNPKKNICWGTEPQKLFEKVEDGKIIGFNSDVLKNLLKFYSNEPKTRNNVDMKPYLDKKQSIVADIVEDEKRDWLEKQYKHMMANKPKHRPLYEIYHWEKIYKIDNKTRVMEPRRRPFELGTNPYARRYDERSPTYIPKAIRPGGPKSKDKFYKTYFP